MVAATGVAHGDVVREIERQLVTVIRYFRGRMRGLYIEDIRQESWMVCLQSADRYDPSIPGAHCFFARIAIVNVAQSVNRWMSRVSLSRAAAREGLGREYRYADDVHERVSLSVTDTYDDPEQACARAETMAELASSRVRWQRVVEIATRRVSPRARAVGHAAIGMSGKVQSVDEIAEREGMRRDDVAADLAKFRRAIRVSPEAREVGTRIARIQEEMP